MADEKKFDLGITVDANLVKQLIAKGVAASLGDADRIIERVVAAAFEQKDPRNYNGKTYFETTIETLIRERAEEVFKEWMKANDEKLREAFRKRLDKDKAKVLDTLVDGLVNSYAQVYVNSISLDIRRG